MQEREKDASGNVYMTIAELKQQEAERRAGKPLLSCVSPQRLVRHCLTAYMAAEVYDQQYLLLMSSGPVCWGSICRYGMSVAVAVRTGQAVEVKAETAPAPSAARAPAEEEEEDDDDEEGRTAWSLERRTAEELVAELAALWQAPMDALANAGKAFEGLEALLGGASGGSFDLKVRLTGSWGSPRLRKLPTGTMTRQLSLLWSGAKSISCEPAAAKQS